MTTNYSKLFAKLKDEGLTQKEFKERTGVGSATLGKMSHNESVTTNTICLICDFFHCMPDEIMDWIPEELSAEQLEQQKQKDAVREEIERLQKKLNSM